MNQNHLKGHRHTALFLTFVILFFQSNLLLADDAPVKKTGRPPARVVVSSVQRKEIQDQIRQIGSAEAWRSSEVATEVAGRVSELLVRRGDRVEKGALLAKLAASSLVLKLKQTQAKHDAARARLEKAQDTLKRSEALKKEGLISKRAYREAKLTVQELKHSLSENEAGRLQAQDALNKKRVHAPFSGIVTQELTEEGEWVGMGGSIVQLLDLSKIRIVVDMPERYIRNITIGESASVQMDAIPETNYTGKIHALIPAGNQATRLFPVEIHVDNNDGHISEGMLARVSFGLGPRRSALMVDKDAVIRKGSGAFLFVVESGKAIKKEVHTGHGKGNFIEIWGDLKEGQLVVIRGNERLRMGRGVVVVDEMAAKNTERNHSPQNSDSAQHSH